MNRSKRIYIFINPKYDSLHHTFDAPEFALKPKNSNVLVLPEWVDTDGRVTPPFTYRYLFNIWGYSPDTLEVIFLKSYHGCDIPNVTFIATKKTEVLNNLYSQLIKLFFCWFLPNKHPNPTAILVWRF